MQEQGLLCEFCWKRLVNVRNGWIAQHICNWMVSVLPVRITYDERSVLQIGWAGLTRASLGALRSSHFNSGRGGGVKYLRHPLECELFGS